MGLKFMNKPEIKLIGKSIYGRNLFYPDCEISEKIASISGIKSFTSNQVESLSEVFHVIFTVSLNSN